MTYTEWWMQQLFKIPNLVIYYFWSMEYYESVIKFSPVNGKTKILMLALPFLGKNVFFLSVKLYVISHPAFFFFK